MNIGNLDPEEIEAWAREAEKKNVRVTYRLADQHQPTTRTMGHAEYLRWVNDLSTNGYVFLGAEQVTK